MQAIEIKNLSFNYGKLVVFKNLNLNILEGSFVTILGKNGSGKTTLANILAGNLKYNGDILIFNKPFDKNNVGFTGDELEYDNYDTVMNILLKKVHAFEKKDVRKRILDLAVEFYFSKYLDKKFDELSITEKKLVVLGSFLIEPVKILIMDNFFEDFDNNLRSNILNKLRKFSKKINMTIINFTNDVEEGLVGNQVVIIGNGKVLLKGSKKNVFENENFFEENDMNLPFVVSLSDKLKFYDLIDKIYLNEKKLVDDLWK